MSASPSGTSGSIDRRESRARHVPDGIGLALWVPLIGLLMVLALLWIPEFLNFQVARAPAPTAEQIEAFRSTPADQTLLQIARQSLAVDPILDEPARVLADADALMRGEWRVKPSLSLPFDVSFRPDDFRIQGSTNQLRIATLGPIDLLLRAHRISKRPDYLITARDYLTQFARWERALWLPEGFVWNDHAIAARSAVLVRFWMEYRNSPHYDGATAGDLVALVARSAAFLAKPSHYTFATNHGVMQNLGLLQLAAAFPDLPEAAAWRSVAMERLGRQMQYYVNAEGVVLEHSAGYHAFGVDLLTMALTLTELNGAATPPEWALKQRDAVGFLRRLARPDGSLPVFGNTDRGMRVSVAPRLDDQRNAAEMFPQAGYAAWWQPTANLGPSQTVMLWSYFPGHGHKHADELSIGIWGAARDWIDNVGYWPYDIGARKTAVGWSGSNAPHLAGERAVSDRHSEVLAWGGSGNVRFLHVRRSGPGHEFAVSRQVLSLSGSTWGVLDFVRRTEPADLKVNWTFAPGLRMLGNGDSYVLSDGEHRSALRVTVSGESSPKLRVLKGSVEPFGGWVVDDGVPVAVPALTVTLPTPSRWLATTLTLSAGDAAAQSAPAEWKVVDEERWQALIASGPDRLVVRRDHDRLQVIANGVTVDELPLAAVPRDQEQLESLERAFALERGRSVFYRDLFKYRLRASWLAGALFAGNVAVAVGIVLWRRRSVVTLSWVSGAAWVMVALWLWRVYLR